MSNLATEISWRIEISHTEIYCSIRDLRYHFFRYHSIKMLIRLPTLVVQAEHLHFSLHTNEACFLMTWLKRNSHWLDILFHIGLF